MGLPFGISHLSMQPVTIHGAWDQPRALTAHSRFIPTRIHWCSRSVLGWWLTISSGFCSPRSSMSESKGGNHISFATKLGTGFPPRIDSTGTRRTNHTGNGRAVMLLLRLDDASGTKRGKDLVDLRLELIHCGRQASHRIAIRNRNCAVGNGARIVGCIRHGDISNGIAVKTVRYTRHSSLLEKGGSPKAPLKLGRNDDRDASLGTQHAAIEDQVRRKEVGEIFLLVLSLRARAHLLDQEEGFLLEEQNRTLVGVARAVSDRGAPAGDIDFVTVE